MSQTLFGQKFPKTATVCPTTPPPLLTSGCLPGPVERTEHTLLPASTGGSHAKAHIGFKWLRPSKNDVISRMFSCKFLHIQIASVSGHSAQFIFKTCQIVAGTSMIRQFNEFCNLIFGEFWVIWNHCEAARGSSSSWPS